MSIAILSILMIKNLIAQEVEDVIYLKDGAIVRGKIIEVVPEDYYKIRIAGGSELKFKIHEISKVTIESRIEYKQSGSKIESWYFHIAFGGSNNSYPEELQLILDEIEKIEGVILESLSFELGFYWPMSNNKTILGIATSSFSDNFRTDDGDMALFNYLHAFSVIHYPMRFIGKGLFIRGDLGAATFGTSSLQGVDEMSETGLGFLIGSGYAWPITGGTRMEFMFGLNSSRVKGENYSTGYFNLGLLF